ncbi:MAG: universal stress protein [Dermatophilaceae bacterium]
MIVVACNGQPDSQPALEWAADEACRRRAGLRIVFVLSMPAVLVGPTGEASALPEEVFDSAHTMTRVAADAVRERGVDTVQTAVEIGSPAAVIVRESADAELVVLGSRGRGDVAAAVLGSVMVTVTSHAHCPVVVVRPHVVDRLDADHGVVVGVDGSRHSGDAVSFAADMASRAQVPLVVLAAWHLPRHGAFGAVWSLTGEDEHRAKAKASAREPVDTIVEGLGTSHPHVTVTGRVVEGDAGVVLAQASRRAGLVVVGCRGVGGFRGLLLGSVSHHVVHDATCPVAVVR